jgi:co-chaperonin GroES (HSP10)
LYFISLRKETNKILFMKILPTMLLVEDQKEEEKIGSIIIPTTLKVDQVKGEVKFTGKGTPDMEMIYEVGDTVVYMPKTGREVEVDGKKMRLMDIREVLFAI